MSKQDNCASKALYEQQEKKISAQSDAMIKLLTKKGILEDRQIDDERIRQAQKEKKRNMYHNTQVLLENYRNIAWALECFPDTIAEELDHPLAELDALLDHMDLEMGMGNRKLESRLESVKKSRLLLDRVNEALTVLKRKPDNGPKMYEITAGAGGPAGGSVRQQPADASPDDRRLCGQSPGPGSGFHGTDVCLYAGVGPVDLQGRGSYHRRGGGLPDAAAVSQRGARLREPQHRLHDEPGLCPGGGER